MEFYCLFLSTTSVLNVAGLLHHISLIYNLLFWLNATDRFKRKQSYLYQLSLSITFSELDVNVMSKGVVMLSNKMLLKLIFSVDL